jgi:sugar lactone lactonase YvrE
MFLRSVGTPFQVAGMRAGLVTLVVLASLLLSLASTAMAQSVPGFTVTTFATGIAGARGVSTDNAGNVYTMGRDDGRVYKISSTGVVSLVADLPDLFSGYIGPHFEPVSGKLFVGRHAASSGTEVLQITSAGVVSVFASGIPAPSGITSDAAGNLYVSTFTFPGYIYKVTPGGVKSVFAGGLNAPDGLVFGPGGDLFVGNRGTHQIMRVPGAGGTATAFASGFNYPLGVTSDGQGNLFVANFGNGVLSKVSSTGAVSTFGTGFSNPLGLAFDSNGNLFVANFGNGTISKISAVSPPANQPPALTVPGSQMVNEGQVLTFNVSATDPDAGQTVTITASGLPVGATFGGGTFSWRPTYNQSGSYTVTFTATDNGSPALSDGPKLVTITVNDVGPIPAPAGLVSLWSAENNANDSADGNNGTLMNGATFASGMVGQAFSFDGADDYVNVPDNSNLDLTTAITFVAWVNPGNPAGEMGMVDKTQTPDNANYRFYVKNAGHNPGNYTGTPFQAYLATSSLPTGQFSHVAITLGGGAISFYVNGSPVSHTTVFGSGLPSVGQANNGPLRIGRDIIGRFFQGRLDEVQLYNRVLSGSEIQSIYASGGLIPNQPPVANAGADQTVECAAHTGTQVTLNGSQSSDPNGDTLTYTWREGSNVLAGPTTSPTSQVTLGLGSHTITLTVSDGKGGTATDQVIITVQDTTPPTLAGVPADATVECDAVPAPAEVSATDACDPAPTVTFSETRTDGSSPDNYTLTRKWTATDHSNNSASATQTLTVQDTKAPDLTLVGDNPVTVECPNPYVDLGVRVTDNCDPNPTLTTDNPVNVHAPGDYTITYTARDRSGNTATLTRTVKVRDTTPPVIAFTVNPTTLWPPNHKMVKVATGISATDACDPSPALSIGVTSNEPVNGLGDGDTAPDWEVANNEVSVRAERSGKGTGRIYTITVTATDASGNTATSTKTVTVAHDQGKKAKVWLAKVGEEVVPEAFGLEQSYPNPFNPSTTIRYALPEASNVSLVVYNLLGQQVRTLVSGAQGPGYHTVVWDGRDAAGRMAATGVYIYRLQAGGFVQVRKMLFAK